MQEDQDQSWKYRSCLGLFFCVRCGQRIEVLSKRAQQAREGLSQIKVKGRCACSPSADVRVFLSMQ